MHYHFSKSDIIRSIYNSKKIYLTKLKKCKGQKDFYLTEKMFFKILKNINVNLIDYKYVQFPKEKFINIINITKLNKKYYLNDELIYGCCLTQEPVNKKFKRKYGENYVSFNLDAILRCNVGYLFVYKTFYSLKNIDQYVYDLLAILYYEGEYATRIALELTEENFPDNYEDMLSRCFYFLKALYKPKKFKFENETRILLDKHKIKTGVVESFVGSNYCYTHNIFEMQYNNHISIFEDKCVLHLDSFEDINLSTNL